jgi:D-cysteine desulfhydrase
MTDSRPERPLFSLWPGLERHLEFCTLGDFPTPVEPLSRLVPRVGAAWGESHVKRDDLTSPVYGGNKVRTLEPWLGHALRQGQNRIFATGAYGSNHAVATVCHAKRLGFRTGVALFPQPGSQTARANLEVSATRADEVVDLWHWSSLPFWMWRTKTGRDAPLIMPPGGATPRGCLGFFSAALELGLQIQSGLAPRPDEIVLALGSTCSTAGLLLGLRVAARKSLGLSSRGAGGSPPRLVAVRVTPWPVTSRYRILSLALETARWLRELTGDRVFDTERGELGQGLEVEGRQLGKGYGLPTPAGLKAIELLEPFSAALDTTYSAKSAAALLERIEHRPACNRLFWSTKSGAPLPEVTPEQRTGLPARMARWLERSIEPAFG